MHRALAVGAVWAAVGTMSAVAMAQTAEGTVQVTPGDPGPASVPPPASGSVQVGTPVPVAPLPLPPPPPGYVYASPMSAIDMRPRPYRGGPVPPGYHLETRQPVAMTIVGGSVLGAGYLTSVLAATISSNVAGSGWGYVPLVGPFIFAAVAASSPHGPGGSIILYDSVPTIAAGLVVDGLAQLVGGALLIAGVTSHYQVLVYGAPPASVSRRGPAWSFGPGAAGVPFGATLGLTL